MERSAKIVDGSKPSIIFPKRSILYVDIVLNMPQSSTHFALTRRICYFLKFIFGTCGANSMIMFLESFFIYIVTFTLHLNVKDLQSPGNLN